MLKVKILKSFGCYGDLIILYGSMIQDLQNKNIQEL